MIEVGLLRYLSAQKSIANRVGRRIFLSRRPKPSKVRGPAITIERMTARRYYPLTGEADCAAPTLRVDVWAKGNNAEQEVFRIFEDIRKAISGFRGTWENEEVLGCTYLAESVDAEAAVDASDDWDFVYGFDCFVHHRQTPTNLSPVPPTIVKRTLLLSTGRLIKLSTDRVQIFEQPINPSGGGN